MKKSIKRIMNIVLVMLLVIILSKNVSMAQFIEEKKYEYEHDATYTKIKSTSDGGYIATGYTYTSYNDTKAILTKFDNNGNIEWEHQNGEEIIDMTLTENNEYIVLVREEFVFLLTKYNSKGDIAYTTQINDLDADYVMDFKSLSATADGGCIIVGYMLLSDNEGIQSPTIFIKIGSSGQLEGNKYDKKDVYFNSVKTTNDGGFIAAGYFNPDLENSEETDGIVVKYDQNANIEWEGTYGGTDQDAFVKVIETLNGEYIIIGNTWSYDIDGLDNNGRDDALIVKYDSKGNLLWDATYGGSESDIFYDVTETLDGKYIAICNTCSEDIVGINKDDSYDAIIVKYNSIGDIEWQTNYARSGDEILEGITINGEEYLAAGSETNTKEEPIIVRFTDFENEENDNQIINNNTKEEASLLTDKKIIEEKKEGISTKNIIVFSIGGFVIAITIIVAIILIRKVLKS